MPATGPTVHFQDRVSEPTRQPSPFQLEETPTPIGSGRIAPVSPPALDPHTGTDPRADNYTRELTNLAKLYTDEDRYSGQTIDSFEYKLTIFQSKSKEFYYQSCQGLVEYTLDQLCEAICTRFKTSERRRANLYV